MTCIVGFADRGTVLLGGDAAASNETEIEIRRDPKVFCRDRMVIGFSESFRLGQLLRFSLVIPKPRPKIDAFEYMATQFVEALRKCAAAGGAETEIDHEDDGKTTDLRGQVMVGYRGRLFRIEQDYHVAERAGGMDAIGAGGSNALAALAAQDIVISAARRRSDLLPYTTRQRILDAMIVAERFTSNVKAPFTIVSTESAR